MSDTADTGIGRDLAYFKISTSHSSGRDILCGTNCTVLNF